MLFKYSGKMQSKFSIYLYELLKSWEKVSEKEFEIDYLKEKLGAVQKSYNMFGKFRQGVLDVAVDEINKLTDLSVTYTTKHAKTKGHKVIAVVFSIKKKKKEIYEIDLEEDQLSINNYNDVIDIEPEETERQKHLREPFEDLLLEKFPDLKITTEELEEMIKNAERIIPVELHHFDNEKLEILTYQYFRAQARHMLAYNSKKKIDSPAGFLKKCVRDDYAGRYKEE